MKKGFSELMKSINQHRATHAKKYLTGKARSVMILYRRLKEELQEIDCGVKKDSDGITIRIIIRKNLLVCDEANSLLRLVAQSNLLIIDTHRGKIILELWFRLWEWERVKR